MATLTKTIQPEAITMQIVNANVAVITSAFDVTQRLSARVFVDICIQGSLSTAPKLEVQTSEHSSGNDTWVVAKTLIPPDFGVNGGKNIATNAIANAGDQTISTGNPVWAVPLGPQYVFIQDPTFANSEWNRIVGRSGNLNSLLDVLTSGHASGTTLVYRASRHTFFVGLQTQARIRFAFENTNTSGGRAPQNTVVRIAWITTDTVS